MPCSSMRELHKKMYVLRNPQRMVATIRRDCTKCRTIRLKTVELKMVALTAD